MPTDPTQGDAPPVDITARPDDTALRAPDTNPALQLAQSLAAVSPDVSAFTDRLGGELQARYSAKATADALANNGQAFADAVRSGKIEPTQNPWYINAYEKQAAQVRAQGQVSAFVTQMQSDPSRNDPAAYATKFNQGLGDIAQQFTGINQSTGFHAAADPLREQALNQNTEYNVQRIQQEHVQNATTLATQAVMDAVKANPKATPDQIFQAMEDQHQTWTAVGGTEPQWRLVVKQAVLGAAANLSNEDLTDVLKAPYLGGTSIANQADETGRPTGLEIDQAKRTIIWGRENDLTADMRARQAAVAKEGGDADAFFNQKYGNDYAFGKIGLPQLQADGVAAGFSGHAINWAVGKMREELLGAAGYSTAQTDVYSSDPVVQQKILGLNRAAVTSGLTPQLSNTLNDMVGRQQIPLSAAEAVMDRASGQSHFEVSEGNAQRRADASLSLQKFAMVGDAIKQAKAKAATVFSSPAINIDFGKLPPKVQESFNKDVEDAGIAVADKGPAAAQEAAENRAETLVRAIIQRYKPGARPLGLVNPNAVPAATSAVH